MNPETPTQAFDRLFDEHRRVLHAFLVGQAGVENAEDLLQETFVRVWRNIEKAQAVPADRQRFWLVAIARNCVLDFHRQRKVRERLEDAPLPPPVPGPEQAAVASDLSARLDVAIACLPETLRTVLTLHVLGGLNSTEVGRLLKRPVGTVRYQLATARKKLADTLEGTNV
jgi:RNA polymerase sigma-70 factor (ECF subfamily)